MAVARALVERGVAAAVANIPVLARHLRVEESARIVASELLPDLAIGRTRCRKEASISEPCIATGIIGSGRFALDEEAHADQTEQRDSEERRGANATRTRRGVQHAE